MIVVDDGEDTMGAAKVMRNRKTHAQSIGNDEEQTKLLVDSEYIVVNISAKWT